MAGGPWDRLFAAKYSPIKSREAGGTCVEDECDSMVVTVVTEDGDEPPDDEEDVPEDEDVVDEASRWRAVASGEDAIMISLLRGGATIGRWLRRWCGIPPRGGAAVGVGEEGISSGGIRVGFARRNVLVLRAKQEETVEPTKILQTRALSRSLAWKGAWGHDSALSVTLTAERVSLNLIALSYFFSARLIACVGIGVFFNLLGGQFRVCVSECVSIEGGFDSSSENY